ncbi:MAG: ABC transporter permease [Chloroflexota bacterium]
MAVVASARRLDVVLLSWLVKIKGAMRNAPWWAVTILVTFLIMGAFGTWIAPQDPIEAHLSDALTPPFFQPGGSMKYPLGTDALGRDILSRLIVGTSVSLRVGFGVVAVTQTIACMVALASGYMGGWVDLLLMRIVDTFMALPFLMIALVLAAVLGPSLVNIIIIFSILGWTHSARVQRSQVLGYSKSDFVRLAIVAGAGKARIMFLHIFPNILNTLVVLATLQVATIIIAEATLSFLGLGVPPPAPSWGSMLADGRSHIYHAWWLCVWPGVAISFVVLSCNFLGDWLRVRLDPKFRQL